MLHEIWDWVGWMWFGRATGGLLSVGATIIALGMTGDWIAKVRDYNSAKEIDAQRARLAEKVDKLLNERDTLRDEVIMLRSSTPYRGPQPAENEGGAQDG